MKNLATVPPTLNKPKFAEFITNKRAEITARSRQVEAGRITLNVTSMFGAEKLTDILFQIASEKIGQNAIGAAPYLRYNNTRTEAKITEPALFSQFGGGL